MALAGCLDPLSCCRINSGPRWYCKMDKELPVYLSIGDAINPDQISNSNFKCSPKSAPCCLQTLKLPFYRKVFRILNHQSRAPATLFCTPIPIPILIILDIVGSLGLVFMSEAHFHLENGGVGAQGWVVNQKRKLLLRIDVSNVNEIFFSRG